MSFEDSFSSENKVLNKRSNILIMKLILLLVGENKGFNIEFTCVVQ